MESLRIHKNERKRISSDAKVAKVFSIVASAFLLCWLPIIYITTADIISRYDFIPDALSIVSFFTIATSSLVNPLMYAFLKPDFKMAIRTCFRKSTCTDTGSTICSLPLASLTAVGTERNYEERKTIHLENTEDNLCKESPNSMENSSQCSVNCKLKIKFREIHSDN